MSTSHSELSIRITKGIDKIEKKEQGIYFTSLSTIRTTIERLSPFLDKITTVLEPSCGSCEYVIELANPRLHITAIEKNEKIYNAIKHLENERLKIIQADFISFTSTNKYDLIIGNPPYFVMKKQDVPSSYYPYFDGRPNIFILFIIKSLSLLNEGGILSFILPKSFLNCLYYNKTRICLHQSFQIIDIIECSDDYIDTKQETVLFIIQKCAPSFPVSFSLRVGDYLIFGTKSTILQLNSLYEGSTTLHQLGLDINVGSVVWNQCKSILTDDDTETRLIYSSDIIEKKLSMKSYSNIDKKNYIKKEGNTEPILVINRGYGVGKYHFEYCLVDVDYPYLIENHLICLSSTIPMEKTLLIDMFHKIMSSFENEKTRLFIELYFGNNAMNTTELKYVFPIYDI